jgi:hypothetical protein
MSSVAKASTLDMATLDLSDVSGAGAVMEVRHPVTNEVMMVGDKPLTITLAGTDSAIYRKTEHAVSDRRLAKGPFAKTKTQEYESAVTEIFAACTLAWQGISLDGEELPCTRQNAVRLYTRLRWLNDQVAEFIKDRTNFFSGSATSSAPPSVTE